MKATEVAVITRDAGLKPETLQDLAEHFAFVRPGSKLTRLILSDADGYQTTVLIE